jgi:isoleucyl-tRNA synthetase
MKAYRLYTVVPRLVDFIDQLTKWYVRLKCFMLYVVLKPPSL